VSAQLVYANQIKSFNGEALPNLKSLPGSPYDVDTMIIISTGERVRVDSGAADVENVGQVAPYDYHPSANNKHFTKVL